MTTTEAPTTTPSIDDVAERVFRAVLGAQEVQAIYLGHRLGWYDALAGCGGLTAGELAERTETDGRYAQEWLEHQAVCGYLSVDDAAAPAHRRRFRLSDAHAEVLTDQDSLAFVAPLARFTAAVGTRLEDVVEAYRHGGGVSWQDHGDQVREAQAAANRPLFLHQLATELLRQSPEVHGRLVAGGRVADVGTGFGWSAIGLALAHPGITVDGFDVDEPSVDAARRNAAAAGVADRVRFHVGDGANLVVSGAYDVVFAFECIHDLPDPVAVLATMGALAAPDGVVVVMDEAVGESFHAPGDEVERLMYGYSITACLPDGRAHSPSAATGTVMRPSTLARYATEAGFASVEVLPIEHDVFRFSRLVR